MFAPKSLRSAVATTRVSSSAAQVRLYSDAPKGTKFLKGKHVLASGQFEKAHIEELLGIASWMKKEVQEKGVLDLLKDKVSANLFYEPSTRTTGSFHTAMMRLGGKVLPIVAATSSVQKGETLEDTIRTVQNYVDVIVIRHPEIGSAAKAASVAKVPIINCGDGANEHPTQALLDMLCIKSELGQIDGLNIAMVGDLKYGRTVHSLSQLLAHYKVNLHFVSPKELAMPEKVTSILDKKGLKYNVTTDLNSVLPKADVVYALRVQKERFDNIEDYNRVKDAYIFNAEVMKKAKSKMILMHPLPRVNELHPEIDNDPRSIYFSKQPAYGMYMRMALLAATMGRV